MTNERRPTVGCQWLQFHRPRVDTTCSNIEGPTFTVLDRPIPFHSIPFIIFSAAVNWGPYKYSRVHDPPLQECHSSISQTQYLIREYTSLHFGTRHTRKSFAVVMIRLLRATCHLAIPSARKVLLHTHFLVSRLIVKRKPWCFMHAQETCSTPLGNLHTFSRS